MDADVPRPRTPQGRRAFDALCADPAAALLALDFDGTLAPIVARPEDARAHPRAVPVLARLAPRLRLVALVTGRPAAEAARFAGLEAVPGAEAHGHYGLERWAAGELDSPDVHRGVAAVRAPLRALVAAAPAGTRLEDKGHSLAVHTRETQDPDGVLAKLRPRIDALAVQAGLEVVRGRYVAEVRPPGVDKGAALRRLVERSGARVVVVAGDDVGDLPAAYAVADLRQHGVHGLVVCADSPECPPALREAADLVVAGPDGLIAWLEHLAERIGA